MRAKFRRRAISFNFLSLLFFFFFRYQNTLFYSFFYFLFFTLPLLSFYFSSIFIHEYKNSPKVTVIKIRYERYNFFISFYFHRCKKNSDNRNISKKKRGEKWKFLHSPHRFFKNIHERIEIEIHGKIKISLLFILLLSITKEIVPRQFLFSLLSS